MVEIKGTSDENVHSNFCARRVSWTAPCTCDAEHNPGCPAVAVDINDLGACDCGVDAPRDRAKYGVAPPLGVMEPVGKARVTDVLGGFDGEGHGDLDRKWVGEDLERRENPDMPKLDGMFAKIGGSVIGKAEFGPKWDSVPDATVRPEHRGEIKDTFDTDQFIRDFDREIIGRVEPLTWPILWNHDSVSGLISQAWLDRMDAEILQGATPPIVCGSWTPAVETPIDQLKAVVGLRQRQDEDAILYGDPEADEPEGVIESGCFEVGGFYWVSVDGEPWRPGEYTGDGWYVLGDPGEYGEDDVERVGERIIERASLDECVHCGEACRDLYQVEDDVWPWDKTDVAHFGCLEDKLGRRLTGSDLIDDPINDLLIHVLKVDRLDEMDREVDAGLDVDSCGFDQDEAAVHASLMQAYGRFLKIDRKHPDELRDFVDSIHRLQDLLGMRVLQRLRPDGWPTHECHSVSVWVWTFRGHCWVNRVMIGASDAIPMRLPPVVERVCVIIDGEEQYF